MGNEIEINEDLSEVKFLSKAFKICLYGLKPSIKFHNRMDFNLFNAIEKISKITRLKINVDNKWDYFAIKSLFKGNKRVEIIF